jgi:5'-3' exonuclease
MGIKDFPALLRDSKVLQNNLKELEGLVLGVDISVAIHRLYRRVDFAQYFHILPSISLHFHIESFFNDLLEVFRKAKVEPVFIFDGTYHSNKAAIDAARKQQVDENTAKFRCVGTKQPLS